MTAINMDTIEIAVASKNLVELLRQRLTTVGKISTRHKDKGGTFKLRKAAYTQAISVCVSGKQILFCFAPRFPSASPGFIRVHLSHHKNWQHFLFWFSEIAGEHLPELMASRLIRTDLCIDIGVPFETIQHAIYCARVVTINRYRGVNGKRTIYLGQRPRVACVYEKNMFPWELDYLPTALSSHLQKTKGTFTRIEVRLLRNYIPVKSLAELPTVMRSNPFSHLKFIQLDPAIVTNLKGPQKHIAQAYLFRCQQVGAPEARLEFNAANNFSRTLGKWTAPLDLDLHKAWMHRTKMFFGSEQKNEVKL